MARGFRKGSCQVNIGVYLLQVDDGKRVKDEGRPMARLSLSFSCPSLAWGMCIGGACVALNRDCELILGGSDPVHASCLRYHGLRG